MSNSLLLFQEEYLKKFSEENNTSEDSSSEVENFEIVLERINKLSKNFTKSKDLHELLNNIDNLRQIVFKAL
jgi:molecular chaperone GrpE (heat shock protein)